MSEYADGHQRYANVPIPSYDEATAHPSSSRGRGPAEISDDAERQGLLGQGSNGARSTYRPPTAESPRASEDSDLAMPEMTDDRRHIEELDYLDPTSEDTSSRRSLYSRARQRTKFTQHLSNLGATLSSIRLPTFRLRSLYNPLNTSPRDPDLPPQPSRWWPLLPSTSTSNHHFHISLPMAARLFGLATIAVLIWALFALDIFPNANRHLTMRYDPESVRTFVQEKVDAANIIGYLRHITSYDHVAGTEGDLFLAEWMKEKWEEVGRLDEVRFSEYFVYLDYPRTDGTGRGVRLVRPQDREWAAGLEEKIIDREKLQTFTWHAMSKSGEAEGHLIYVNEGRLADYEWLKGRNVGVQTGICLLRHIGGQEELADKVKTAEIYGCEGVLVFADSVSANSDVWPDGPHRPDDAVLRKSVARTNWVVGDPLTPGYASTRDTTPIAVEESTALPKIPSLPISASAARTLLARLRGHGVQVLDDWRAGALPDDMPWFSGSSPTDDTVPIVRIENLLDENEKQQIWNVHGMMWGQETPSKKVIVGAHRDAWCFGASNPGSGAAILMELVDIFGQLRDHGWRPLRTIEFVSWDAKEYNMMGSTEFVEEFSEELRAQAYAYLNVDSAVLGPSPEFTASGSPVWTRSLLHTLNRISLPGANETLRTVWERSGKSFRGLDTEGDYVAFQNLAGTSSIDFGFRDPTNGQASSSCYDTYDWMIKFGDPNFQYHTALAQVWALMILEVADRPLVPLDLRVYADAIQNIWLPNLEAYAALRHAQDFDLALLVSVAENFSARAAEFHNFEETWTANVRAASGLENNNYAIARIHYNDAISNFERDLLDLPFDDADILPYGMPGREQFKHIITSPRAVVSGDDSSFPAVRDALDAQDWNAAQEQVTKAARILARAVDNLIKSSGS